MSLALLPSTPLTSGRTSIQEALAASPSASKRPKLSLNTSTVPSGFGKGVTSLRLETLSATSPTARNTFQNRDGAKAKDDATRGKVTLTPLLTNMSPISASQPTAESVLCHGIPDASVLTASPVASLPSQIPYILPQNTSSILTNGPIKRPGSQDSESSRSRASSPKRVAFRIDLTEDIKTTMYTFKHSDICQSPALMSVSEASRSRSQELATEEPARARDGVQEAAKAVPRPGIKRASFDLEETDDRACPTTPVAGRAKRQKWVWTLGSD
ncbi:hypothetical protein BDY17DRAFT_327774 [Neohortaea acidophila]|uniref:Uncharacterized protein n=1 Tax=Neohortaea acidophila TaxID=245834 RepID=A0A6A6PGA8_9PEZI|nr:uncharacterized protein BDY17DRAFT_327774 [Neohortaea acidophila]KAF2478965.1 hypothetical protein BDY17DRAFT_327774 [Neohortaea acidophila]